MSYSSWSKELIKGHRLEIQRSGGAGLRAMSFDFSR
jgi:hypothetical protein